MCKLRFLALLVLWLLCHQRERYHDDRRENSVNSRYHKSKLMKVAPTASIQHSRFVAFVARRLAATNASENLTKLIILVLLRLRQDWQSWNMLVGRRLTKATKFQQQPWLFRNWKMKKFKYHWFRCMIYEMRPEFHADFNGLGLKCDNDAQNEKF